ncbi:MAG TPA: EamA family transporter [Candidatus Angelobacter sp.]|nr:EamA family transporter [Candidatus Angelobacter sp.]
MDIKHRIKGTMMVTIGAAFWGISGTVAQQLFQNQGVSVGWLVTVRLLFAGLFLLLFSLLGKKRARVWTIWQSPKRALQLLVFGLFGLLGVQYTYFASINRGNAAVATLLQYLAPLFILIYFMLRQKVRPRLMDGVSIALALIGTYFLLTNGHGGELHLPLSAVFWGILSGVALAFYTVYPGALLAEWGSPIVMGWGMFIGGIGLSFFTPPWQTGAVQWSLQTVSFIGFVILFGTLIAFYLYLESLTYISPKEASLLACTEPLTSVITAVVWLGVTMGVFQSIGAACVILMILLLALKPSKPAQVKDLPINLNEIKKSI